MNNYRHLPHLAASFAAVLLAAGCATRPSASPITLLAPSEGAVVPTLGDGQKAYLALPRAERVKKFADPKYRTKMRSFGYYPKPLELAWTNAAPSEAPSAYAVKVVRLTDKAVVFATNFTSFAASGSLLVDNLEIARPYGWSVSANGRTTYGHFSTEDIAPRLVRLPGVPNVRDLGGRVGLDGRRVKQGLVYRTAGLNENASPLYYTDEELARQDPSFLARKTALVAEARKWRAFEDEVRTNAAALPLVSAKLSAEWTVFRPDITREGYATNGSPELAKLNAIPEEFMGAKAGKLSIGPGVFQKLGKECSTNPVVLLQMVDSPADGYIALSAGGDYWWELRSNGESVFDLVECGNWRYPYTPESYNFAVPVRKGPNLIAVTVFSGTGGWAWGWNVPKVNPGDLVNDRARIAEKLLEARSRLKKGMKKGKNRLHGAALDYALHTMGIRSDIDLRSDGECWGMTGSPLGKKVAWFHYSSASYGSMQKDWGREAFTKVFRVFLDKRNYPIDFHCIAGQDRTGAVAFILNGLLGVDEEELYRDWEATGFWNPSASFNHARLFDNLYDGFAKWPGETINERIEAYVLDLGFTKKDIGHFRDIMLEK